MSEDHDESLDTAPSTEEPPISSGSSRLCTYSGCRAPLPPSSGPGNKARYCQDGKVWGSKGVSCKQAGHAEELLASVGAPVLPTAPALGELGERIGAALDPARELVATLERVGSQLESEVVEAQRERDEALREAAEERGQRQLADARAADAERAAAESVHEAESAATQRTEARAEAERAAEDRRDAEAERRAAEDARLRAETRSEELRQRAEESSSRLQRATERAEQAEQQAASVSAEIATLRARLDDERSRHEAERQRAETENGRLRTEHAEALDHARAEQETNVQRLRDEWEQERNAAERRHAQQVAELNRQVGARDHELTEARSRAATTTEQLDRLRAEIDDLLVRDPATSLGSTAPAETAAHALRRLLALLDHSRS